MAEPYEILASPFEVYLAPAGSSFPDVDEDPTSSPYDFTLLGTNGADNQGDEGVTAEHQQTINYFRGGKATGPIKAWRTEEGLLISIILHDVSAETYGKALNNAEVTDTPPGSGTPGTRAINLHQGVNVATHALLARSLSGSAYGDELVQQYQVPKVVQQGQPSVVYRKGQPAGVQFQFMAMEDLDAASEAERFGQLVVQDAAATS